MCLTSHTGGVTLMVAPKTGKAGQQGNSVGDYICSDLACSLYVRGKRVVKGLGGRPPEGLPVEEKVERTVANLAAVLRQRGTVHWMFTQGISDRRFCVIGLLSR